MKHDSGDKSHEVKFSSVKVKSARFVFFLLPARIGDNKSFQLPFCTQQKKQTEGKKCRQVLTSNRFYFDSVTHSYVYGDDQSLHTAFVTYDIAR